MTADLAVARQVRIAAGGGALPLLLIGAVCGLTWAASLRGFMTQIVAESQVTWTGTFGWILLPGAVTGLLLAWAEHLRRSGGRRGWRWLAVAPLAFASVLVPGLLDPAMMFSGGIGGGAIGVPVYGMLGGFALTRRGSVWARVVCGLLFLSMVPIWIFTVTSFGGSELAVGTARGTWVALWYWSLIGVLALACAIPHRPIVGEEIG